MQVNVHDAKSSLSRLLAAVEAGQDVVIARDGKPVARLVPVDTPAGQPQPGWLKDKIWIGDDVDDPLPAEWVDAFGLDGPPLGGAGGR